MIRLLAFSVTISVQTNKGESQWTLVLNEDESIEEFMLRVATTIDEMTEVS